MNFKYEKFAQAGRARAGVFHTPHGDIPTPVFAPVGTAATVKGVPPRDLKELGATLVLSNTYHLYLRPGDDLVARLGGLHQFMGWNGPMLTDSGGFQVFSLPDLRKVDDDGVMFRSHLDGSLHRFTPEKVMSIEENLGADIGIVQGGVFPDLREQSARFLMDLDFPGYALGGLAVGETKEQMHAVLDLADQLLPENKPRYLMGMGTAEDFFEAVSRGVDIFDCVLPTRLARHGAAFTHTGRINLRNQSLSEDHGPIEDGCTCYACRNFTRGYIRHLMVSKEILG